jgi:DNA (cytosine-5)-methyltransferase 1
MFGIMEMAREFNTSKSLVLRAAVNIGIYDPINDKKTKFNTDEKKKIKSELKNILKIKKHSDKLAKIQSDNFLDISEGWNSSISVSENIEPFKFEAVDLFAGAGGVALGLISEQFKPIVSSEIFKEAIDTYNHNFSEIIGHRNSLLDVNDIKLIENKIKSNHVKNGDIDLIIGGFPCQGFSVAGIRSENDPRNSLYYKMFELVRKVQPKVVVMENVLGLLTMKNGEGEYLIDKICSLYESIGYTIDYRVLNAADYGVAQLRKRVIIMANKIGTENLFPKPIYDADQRTSVKNVLKYYENWEEDVAKNHIFTKHKKETILKLKRLKIGKSLYDTFSDAWKKLDPNMPSGTIKENHGGVNVHYSFPRVLTPREMAKLQSFPDDFIFMGNKSKQLVQIGNAVPPLLSKAIARCVKYMLEHKNDK